MSSANTVLPEALAMPSILMIDSPIRLSLPGRISALGIQGLPRPTRSAAMRTLSRIFLYPVHLQTFLAKAFLISASSGEGFLSRRALADMMKPGVQKPHWTAPALAKEYTRAETPASSERASMVTTLPPSRSFIFVLQARTDFPSTMTVQAPQCPSLQPFLVPVSLRTFLR